MKDIRNAHLIFFSPTKGSSKVAHAVSEGLNIKSTKETDLTYMSGSFSLEISNTLVVIAVPVYGGRVAPMALKRLQNIKAVNCPTVLIAVYGNRAYEDTLVELYDETLQLGFTPIAAATFIAEHSFSVPDRPIAKGRPNSADLEKAKQFGKDVLLKLQSDNPNGPLSIPGNRPYRELNPSAPITPLSGEGCTVCESCLLACPTGAVYINSAGVSETNAERCIKCCACVRACPTGERSFHTPFTVFLHTSCQIDREPELFL